MRRPPLTQLVLYRRSFGRALAATLLTLTVVAITALPASAVARSPVPATAVAPMGPTNASTEGWIHPTLASPSPGGRDAPAMTYDSKDGYVLMFGGCGKIVCPLWDTWKYVGGVWANLTSTGGPTPPARQAASLAYDARDGYAVLFGGAGSAGPLGDTWTFQYGRWTTVGASPGGSPAPRSGASMIYDPVDSEVLLFGGAGSTGVPDADTWSFAGGVWTNISATVGSAPPARSGAGFAFDTTDHEGVLFGGSGSCGLYCGDTWAFQGGRWANLTSAVGSNIPSARTGGTMAYDDGRGLIVLIGGQNGVLLADTWGYSHGTWMYLSANSTSSPGPRANIGAAFDPADDYLVAYGGHTSTGPKFGTFLLLTPLSSTVGATLTTVVPGEAVQFTATATGGYGLKNVSWNFGDGTPVVVGPSAGHTYFATGTFVVTATVTDGLGIAVASALTVTVELPPFTVAIAHSPSSPVVGQTVTLVATPTGGTSPYQFQWSGDVATCSGTTMPSITCSSTTPRTLAISVSVIDVAHRSATASTSVPFAAGSTGLIGPGPSPSVGPVSTGLSTTFTVAYLTGAIFAACVVGVVTYRVGRRREAARRALRPLCYAVPAWSETPADFSDTPPSEPSPSGPGAPPPG